MSKSTIPTCVYADCTNPSIGLDPTMRVGYYPVCAEHMPKPVYRPPLDRKWARMDVILTEESKRRVKSAVSLTR